MRPSWPSKAHIRWAEIHRLTNQLTASDQINPQQKPTQEPALGRTRGSIFLFNGDTSDSVSHPRVDVSFHLILKGSPSFLHCSLRSASSTASWHCIEALTKAISTSSSAFFPFPWPCQGVHPEANISGLVAWPLAEPAPSCSFDICLPSWSQSSSLSILESLRGDRLLPPPAVS